jgi:ATPase involved in DNA replication initiation
MMTDKHRKGRARPSGLAVVAGPPAGRRRRSAPAPGRDKYMGEAARVRIVLSLVEELFDLACEGRRPIRGASRRAGYHARQIAIYLCRVELSMHYRAIAVALGRHISTVIHACAAVEDRRDDRLYDGFVDRCARCVRAVFGDGAEGEGGDGRA